jgi:hypothetical protein
MMSKKFGSFFCLTLLLILGACNADKESGKDKKGGSTAKGDEPTWAPFSADAPKIEFDDTAEVPPLDNGRMNIKVLDGWKETNQKRPGMLFIYLKGGKPNPVLLVHKPEDAPAEIKDLDDTGKTAFLADVTSKINDKYKGYILDKPKVIDINGRPWVFYRVKMASASEKLEVAFLTTVANGRKYTVELRAIEKKGNHDWPALLTMASGMSFAGDMKPADPMPEPSKSEPPKTEPAATEPAKEPAIEPAADK